MSQVLKIILLAVLKLASSRRIAHNFNTDILLGFFSSMMDTPLVYLSSHFLFRIAKFIKSFLI